MTENAIEAIEQLYGCRTNYTIIALTGKTATGRSRLASYMSDKDFVKDETAHVRNPHSVAPCPLDIDYTELHQKGKIDDCHSAISSMMFSRKYNICYNYVKENYEPFVVIKYTYVLWFFSLLKIRDKIQSDDNKDLFKEEIEHLLEDKYRPSHKNDVDSEYKKLCSKLQDNGKKTYLNFRDVLDDFGQWEELYKQICSVDIDVLTSLDSYTGDTTKLFEVFEKKDGAFCCFVNYLNIELAKLDYYCLCFLYHRLGVVIRNTGNPLVDCTESYNSMGKDSSHIYDVVKLINILIKGCRKTKDPHNGTSKNHCRVVIDSIRNSMEALFFKERYSAFYLVAVHDEKNPEEHLRKKLESQCADFNDADEKKEYIDEQLEKVLKLGEIESKGKEVEKGMFASPNVSQCIADSEIHISNINDGCNENVPWFYSMAEQWMKYAALIQHPGLITPSSEERCMEVAFTAKLNSGCLSRQVGAVITNKYHSIRTIGWNDVPYGHIPCSLRELTDLVSGSPSPFVFSEYERSEKKVFEGDKSFIDCIRNDYPTILKPEYRSTLKGLPLSYCFKSLQNKYEGEKNQVFTRSLHAEENAMMQMVKFGGESLMDGIIYVTASPCDLCCKKLYQIGVRKIVYIDEYPGISRPNIIENGYKRPLLKQFQGAYGATYYKLYQPFMAYKDELAIRTKGNAHGLKSASNLLKDIMGKLGGQTQNCYSKNDCDEILKEIDELKEKARKYDEEHSQHVSGDTE